jgi:L-alanine-DL-glutamate epimerase-like enolase superfamily enzyme
VVAVLPRLEEALAVSGSADPFALERNERLLEQTIGRNPAARVAISAALHDLVGKRLGLPVWKLWGLDPAAAPPSSFTLGIDEPEIMRSKLREAAGYPILKVKVGTPRDETVLSLIREEAPQARLWVDANTAWDVKQALSRLPMLEEYGVELIEQPLPPDDLEGLRLLRSRARLPILADESCRTAADIPRLVGCVDGINIKLAKCGSLREALRMVHVARAHQLRVMLGCMIESTLGIAAAMQLTPLVDYVDLDGAALLANDPFKGPGLEPDGRLRFNTAPGLGVERA